MVRLLGEGDHFGEVAILKNVKRTLSVRAKSKHLKLLVLTREAFSRILGSIRDYLKEDYQRSDSFDTSFESASDTPEQPQPHLQQRKEDLSRDRSGMSRVLPGI